MSISYSSLYIISALVFSLILNTLFVINSNATENSKKIYLYPVEIDEKWGYINDRGTVVIEPAYEAAYKFSEGFGLVKINSRWGYINSKGETVIQPVYEEAHQFSDGMAHIKEGEKYGFINSSGELVVVPAYEEVLHFSEGVAAVKQYRKSSLYESITSVFGSAPSAK